ncbi:hypothetical protein [Mesorhizobium silamurunense]|uniref:hypothetical protein n=1 Tax=Mesorhizobium silamurunense TaxID=499528 RepID=UPI001780B1AA|nr:hypothetical protein [Mesorhizobium silamurunense]
MNMTSNFWNRLLMAAAALSACTTLAQAHQDAAASVSVASPLADKVRAANSRFLDVKAATAEGYAPIPCASGITGGAMGIHYVNGQYLKEDKVDIARPEAVMYEPMADGTLKLVAVEYITSKGPASLEGQLFNFNSAPNRYGLGEFYELHVWAWKGNPTGTFADMNPKVSCEHAAVPTR